MKKLFTLAFAALAVGGLNSAFAQEEVDVTHYIQNPGFDEDISFTSEGKAAKTITNTGRTTSRSAFWTAADGSIYTLSNDGATVASSGEKSFYGFITRIKGWEVTNTSDSPEWVYFGSVPHDIQAGMLGIGGAANTAQTADGCLAAPGKFDESDDTNTGFLYLRAGWGGQCTYKQEVTLPCAEYRLEYWAKNANPSATITADAKNLTKITCRKDVFEDETGFSDKEWKKHEIIFTPTATFTMEFGYQSAGISNQNPWVCIDGIKLYRIGDADEEELVRSDNYDLQDELSVYMQKYVDYDGLIAEIENNFNQIDDADGDLEAMKTANQEVTAYLAKLQSGEAIIAAYDAQFAQAKAALAATDYPGKAALQQAVANSETALATAGIDDFTPLTEGLQKAVRNYYFSQAASVDSPADYTFLIKYPKFTTSEEESNDTRTSEGWTKGSTYSGGDQRTNYTQNRTCWNAWWNVAKDAAGDQTMDIHQDLTELPAGYYKLTADFITQAGGTGGAHAYISSATQSSNSPFLTEEGWNSDDPTQGVWTELATGQVIVLDGNLTLGARTSKENAAGLNNIEGWFCATNFKLLYLGPVSDADAKAAYEAKIAEAKALSADIKFAGDKAAFDAVVKANDGATTVEGYNEALAAINEATTTANASIKKYNDVMAGSLNDLKTNTDYTDNQKAVAKAATDIMEALMAADDATYTTMDDQTVFLRAYRDTYLPVLGTAEALEVNNAEAKDLLAAEISSQVAELSALKAFPTADDLTAKANSLNKIIAAAKAADVIESGASDVTALITNPTIDGSPATGWTFDNTDGDGNGSKSGQQYNGDTSGRYIDSYNSEAGKMQFTAYQVINNVPNGTYELKAMMRASGTQGSEGVYLFANDAAGIENVDAAVFAAAHIQPTDIAGTIGTGDGEEAIQYLTDKGGPIWEAAYKKIYVNDDKTATEEEQAIADANNGTGRGWFYVSLPVEVTNNVLTIGVTNATALTGGKKDTDGADCVPFSGTWFSADNFTLTLKENKQPGYNPITGIDTVKPAEGSAADGIYSIDGRAVKSLNGANAGIYIIRANGKTSKVLVK